MFQRTSVAGLLCGPFSAPFSLPLHEVFSASLRLEQVREVAVRFLGAVSFVTVVILVQPE